MPITVTPVDTADTATIEQAYSVVAAAVQHDLPDLPPVSRPVFFASVRQPMPGNEFELVLAYLDGVPAGCLRIELPQLDNTENTSVDLDVHPAYRRRGVGRALFGYLRDRVRQLGRKRITSMSVATRPGGAGESPGTAFAIAVGARPALLDARRRLDLTALDRPTLDRLLTDARSRATGYTLVRWSGRTPEEYLDDVAYLDGRLLGDAPMGDLEWEPMNVDAARIKGVEAARETRQRRAYHCATRHDGSGRLVAWTMIDIDGTSPWHAYQQITIVEPKHRGHRLGVLVKIENLWHAVAHEPQLTVIDTWNAASNQYMITINEAMGFRLVDNWHNWQFTL